MTGEIYLDNAATSFPKPEEVYSAVMKAMRDVGASPGRGGYGSSLEASRMVFQSREALSAFFNLPDSSRMIFTHNATMSINMALRGILKPGDHLVTTSMEHNSLLRPAFMLRKAGVELTVVNADCDGMVDPELIRSALRPETRMVALSHVSNVTGGIQPVERISTITRPAGIVLLLDAAQSAGIIPLDMQAMGVDMLAAPGHKGLLGPQGTGILALMPGIHLSPMLGGGTGGSSDQEDQPDGYPEGFEAGTINLPGIAGLHAGVEFMAALGVESIGQRELAHGERLREHLSKIPGCAVYGPSRKDLRTGLVSLTIEGMDPAALAFELDSGYGIAVRSGLHCAPYAHRTIGTYPQGTLRVSPGCFTTDNDIDSFIKALAEITRKGEL